MGGFKITNLADGAASTDAATYGQTAHIAGGNTFTGNQSINGNVVLSGDLTVSGAVIFTAGSLSLSNLSVSSVASVTSLRAENLMVASVASLNTLTVASTAAIGVLSVGSSIVVGAASGGSKGAGTINAAAYYVNGTALANVGTYTEGTFTPTVTFGGASVGITYTTQTGRYTRIGNRVFFSVIVTLSNKGSSTGTAVVAGLPLTSGASNFTLVQFFGVSGMSGMTFPLASVSNSAAVVGLFQQTSTTFSLITDANFTNTSSISVTGFYEV